MTIKIDNQNYEVIITKKRQKNMYLRVKENLKIYINAPTLTPNIFIEKFINNNIEFIKKQINKMKKRQELNNKYMFLGNEIKVVYDKNIKKQYYNDKILFIKDEKDIESFYKNQAKIIFLEHLNNIYKNFKYDIPYPKLCIRKMTTRWGVNNVSLKKVTLNLELIKKDSKYLDYVIVHELSHFIEANHSKNFWKVVSKHSPNYKY